MGSLVELLSHFGCDLLSLLAVLSQVFDLHREHAVPHRKHRLFIWQPRQTNTLNRWRKKPAQQDRRFQGRVRNNEPSDSPFWFLCWVCLRHNTSTTFSLLSVSIKKTEKKTNATFSHRLTQSKNQWTWSSIFNFFFTSTSYFFLGQNNVDVIFLL